MTLLRVTNDRADFGLLHDLVAETARYFGSLLGGVEDPRLGATSCPNVVVAEPAFGLIIGAQDAHAVLGRSRSGKIPVHDLGLCHCEPLLSIRTELENVLYQITIRRRSGQD